MILDSFKNFKDFELLDSGNGYRLERWDEVILQRPDPQIIWPKSLPEDEWNKAWAKFVPGNSEDKGKWDIKKHMPYPWTVEFNNVKFLLKLSPFKHTGLFAEQAANWEWMLEKISKNKKQEPNKNQVSNLKILNLFAYTGGATMVLAKAGASVTHVDASKPTITWANENYKLNFGNTPPVARSTSLGATLNTIEQVDSARDEHSLNGNVRWILDDCAKFAKREVKRGAKYDGIIMDPPAFGHSPDGKTWRFNADLPGLLNDCIKLLSDDAKFLLINGYATNSSALALNNLLQDMLSSKKGKIDFGELCLKQKSNRLISTGIFARWHS
jgi:23S rRNA (cytosine1962-C5)-methyltransferase